MTRRRKKWGRKRKKKRRKADSASGLVATPQPSPLEQANDDAKSLGKLVLQTLFAVASTYIVTLVSFYWGDQSASGENPGAGFLGDAVDSELLRAAATMGVIFVFTCSHLILPAVLFTKLMAIVARVITNPDNHNPAGCLGVLLAVPLPLFWFGVPIFFLALDTGWLVLVWASVHLIIARRCTKWWVYVEYGSTCGCQLVFIGLMSTGDLFPLGLLAALFHTLILTILGATFGHNYITKARSALVPVT